MTVEQILLPHRYCLELRLGTRCAHPAKEEAEKTLAIFTEELFVNLMVYMVCS